MRVIAGKVKGFKLKTVPGSGTRPIMDRVKESLFNIIGPDIGGASFWDIYAGTGSVGIEALSRGASFVRFSEISNKAISTVKANLKITQLEELAEVIRGDSLALLERSPDRQFDYIYIAPPQYLDLWIETLEKLDKQPGWLADEAWVIVQIDPREYKEIDWETLIDFDRRKYGSTLLVFYKSANEITS